MRQSYRFAIAASLCALFVTPALASPGHPYAIAPGSWATGMPHSASGPQWQPWQPYRDPRWMAPQHQRPMPPPMHHFGPTPWGMTGAAPRNPWGYQGMPPANPWPGSGQPDVGYSPWGYGPMGYGNKGYGPQSGGSSDYGPSATGETEVAAGGNSIAAVAQAAGGFDTLLAAATAGGLAEALATSGPFTVFAPIDAAFAELPQAAVNNLLQPENRDTLAGLLQHHVVAGRLDAAAVLEAGQLESLAGTPLRVEVDGDVVRVGGVRILQTDIGADNGVIHVVEQVLFPEGFACIATAAQRAGQFNTLLAAAEAAGLSDALSVQGPFTVFAPSDAAFAALPEGTVEILLLPENRSELQRILENHIVPGRLPASDVLANSSLETLANTQLEVTLDGDQARIAGVAITTTDIMAGNGVIHVVDAVLMP